MANSVEFVLGHLLYSNGKEIEEYISELVCVSLVVNKKMYVKFVHLICSLDCQSRSEIKDVEKMVNCY